ncbi:hypothetical protein [Streptomyces vilmorinianum]|uniref:hypothetical protein n=1 Tax=Streptomyces vilmorinianum TaxID=3051092 RepID=UPI0010FB1886|nr:hypothetical protein [Streptomyces vilmorinianum]
MKKYPRIVGIAATALIATIAGTGATVGSVSLAQPLGDISWPVTPPAPGGDGSSTVVVAGDISWPSPAAPVQGAGDASVNGSSDDISWPAPGA